MPNHFQMIALGSSRLGPDDEYVFRVEDFNKRDRWNFCDQVRPMPEDIKGEVPGENPPWLVWARENWGTQWGTYGEKAYELGGDGMPVLIEFQTAWTPPSEDCLALIARWMDTTLGLQDVKFMGYNPANDQTYNFPGFFYVVT